MKRKSGDLKSLRWAIWLSVLLRFTLGFIKSAWDVVKDDLLKVCQEFFANKVVRKSINCNYVFYIIINLSSFI